MSISGEAILAAVRRASEATGVLVSTDDVIDRLKLERVVEIEARKLDRCSCGDFDWDED